MQLKLNGTHISDSLDIASNFNDYFIMSVQELSHNFSLIYPDQIIINHERDLNLQPTDEAKLKSFHLCQAPGLRIFMD